MKRRPVVDSVTKKVLISDTTLGYFILPQVSKTTPKLCQICGFELCIIIKDIQIDLNRSWTNIATYLQHKYVGIHTHNSEFITTSSTNDKDKVFPDGECLHATIKDADQCISCTPIKLNNIIHIKRDLFFCDNCPD